ncbi:hypothetical protein E6C27_scaffold548G001430 [Cucumis melo var. makuwa]|uniref:Uncharacterized protein n=1 Tax=Cucumis melo var. makuwa TaxID=1194695 RepID=A0A5A7VEP3_CUCMM|nr:hypothetical protein E6C27_scaffold548G001430 [Cucumis melo var. makuwa]
MMPTHHDSTISMEQSVLVYCIMEHLLVNIGKIISKHIIAWVKHPHEARHFMHLIERLCLKACLSLEQLPYVEVKDGVWNTTTLHRIIFVHKNKVKFKCLKTKQDGLSATRKGVVQEEVNNPLQRKLEINPEVDSKTRLPSPPKSTLKDFMRLEQKKETIRGGEDEVDKDYIFKFMEIFICKPLENGIEDIIKC